LYLKKFLYTQAAIKKVKEDVAPRFKNLDSGFTRVQYVGRRNNDKAEQAIIEFVDNPLIDHEREYEEKMIADENIHSFWEWEHKLLLQEIEYWTDKLKEQKDTEDFGVQEMIKML